MRQLQQLARRPRGYCQLKNGSLTDACDGCLLFLSLLVLILYPIMIQVVGLMNDDSDFVVQVEFNLLIRWKRSIAQLQMNRNKDIHDPVVCRVNILLAFVLRVVCKRV